MHTCIHAYMHTCIHACIHTYIHIYIHIYIHTYTHIHTYIPTYIHTCVRTYIHTYTHIHTYIHTYMHAYIHTYTHIHTYIYIYLYIYIFIYMIKHVCDIHLWCIQLCYVNICSIICSCTYSHTYNPHITHQVGCTPQFTKRMGSLTWNVCVPRVGGIPPKLAISMGNLRKPEVLNQHFFWGYSIFTQTHMVSW